MLLLLIAPNNVIVVVAFESHVVTDVVAGSFGQRQRRRLEGTKLLQGTSIGRVVDWKGRRCWKGIGRDVDWKGRRRCCSYSMIRMTTLLLIVTIDVVVVDCSNRCCCC